MLYGRQVYAMYTGVQYKRQLLPHIIPDTSIAIPVIRSIDTPELLTIARDVTSVLVGTVHAVLI
jgi:hypothetical protein